MLVEEKYEADFDESGMDGGPVITLACLISDVERWKHFDQAWRRKINPKGITDFHMSDCATSAQHSEFEGWELAEKLKFCQPLARYINSHVVWAATASMAWRDYQEIMGPRRPLIRLSETEIEVKTNARKDPYLFCLQALMERLVEAVPNVASEGARCIFHTTDEMQGSISHQFNLLVKARSWGHIFRTIAFAQSMYVAALQGADMLAWVANHYWSDDSLTGDGAILHPVIRDIFNESRRFQHLYEPREALIRSREEQDGIVKQRGLETLETHFLSVLPRNDPRYGRIKTARRRRKES